MRDRARIDIEVGEDGGTGMAVSFLRESATDKLPDESNAMFQANVIVALYQIELTKMGPEALVDYVENHRGLWAPDMEELNADGSPVGEPVEPQQNCSVKLGK